MKNLRRMFVATAVSFAAMGSASATTTYSFSFESQIPTLSSGSGTIVTEGNSTSSPELVTSISGTYADAFTSPGSISLVPVGGDTYFSFDDLFGGTPAVDGKGLVFSVAGKDVNLFYNAAASTYLVDDHINFPGVGFFDFTTSIEFTVKLLSVTGTVPEPASGSLLLAGLAALGLVTARKRLG